MEGVETQVLDHHGLVAATCDDLRLAERIDKRLSGCGERIVSFGKACMAMVLNGLGFTNRPLYLTPQFFASKAAAPLLGPGIEARHLNDDALGDTLDAIGDYDPSTLFAEIVHEVAVEADLLSGPLHVDTTSFSVAGDYVIHEAAGASEADNPKVIKLTHGFSKAHRPDLKRAVLSLAVAGGLARRCGWRRMTATPPTRRPCGRRFTGWRRFAAKSTAAIRRAGLPMPRCIRRKIW